MATKDKDFGVIRNYSSTLLAKGDISVPTIPEGINILLFIIHNVLCDNMQEATIISIRIPKVVKTRMRELGIKASEAAREGIEMEIRRKELSKLQKKATAYRGKWVIVPDRQIARDVREYRDSR
ncbi:hypothetical protein M1589_04930 [Candidatus Marsarchaeota archaeon]|nr:hypothetical protein [Candidatus Marsarchaeota archaeon]